ncbi:MAG: TadE/TadG family type IV pilus assembly protein [Candidatus Dormibacteria bacterium]
MSRGSRGQGLVEFALTASIFITLFLGIIEGGRAVLAYNGISQAAREGARYAQTHPTDQAGIRSAALSQLGGFDTSHIVIVESTSVQSLGNGGATNSVQAVTVSVTTPYVPLAVLPAITLTASSTLNFEPGCPVILVLPTPLPPLPTPLPSIGFC